MTTTTITPQNQKLLSQFKTLAVVEGISFLLLMFIAMPLKYLAGMPLMVKYVGWAHGVLFIAYCAMLLLVWVRLRWDFLKVSLAFVASLVPFGPFVFNKRVHA